MLQSVKLCLATFGSIVICGHLLFNLLTILVAGCQIKMLFYILVGIFNPKLSDTYFATSLSNGGGNGSYHRVKCCITLMLPME